MIWSKGLEPKVSGPAFVGFFRLGSVTPMENLSASLAPFVLPVRTKE
jgi:hypothetical protein